MISDSEKATASSQKLASEKLRAIKRKIEAQTGFPSELKAAKIILNHGWTYQSNPRWATMDQRRSDSGITEIDFLASISPSNKGLSRILGSDGYLSVQVAMDVKKYSRPLVVFTSPLTDRDHNDIYSDVYVTSSTGDLKSRFCLLHWRNGPFRGDEAGRSAVVINNEGARQNDYDFHQIYSTLRSVYDGCRMARAESRSLVSYTGLNQKSCLRCDHSGNCVRWVDVCI